MPIARARRLLALGCLIVTACSGGADEAGQGAIDGAPAPGSSVAATVPVTTAPAPVPSTSVTTTPASPPTSAPTDRADCVVTVEAGDSLGRIAGSSDDLTIEDLQRENRLGDSTLIHPGDELDVCIDNEFDDVTGVSREPPSAEAVRAQQAALNELFDGYSLPELLVDGVSGPLTRQALCAARMGLDLPVDAVDMPEGSPEEDVLLEATSLSIPDGAATWARRWILIDKTCQVVFTGEGDDRVVDVFPTSTGEPGYETRAVAGVEAFRYDPAVDNDGWHDSANFPVEIDNPLNGNMYRPLYFNRGQAIHGANYVPPEPRSKGCARLFPWHQDRLLSWLGLDDLTEATWNPSAIGVVVTAQGRYRPVE